VNEGDAEPVVDTVKFEIDVEHFIDSDASTVDPVLILEQSRTADTAGAVES